MQQRTRTRVAASSSAQLSSRSAFLFSAALLRSPPPTPAPPMLMAPSSPSEWRRLHGVTRLHQQHTAAPPSSPFSSSSSSPLRRLLLLLRRLQSGDEAAALPRSLEGQQRPSPAFTRSLLAAVAEGLRGDSEAGEEWEERAQAERVAAALLPLAAAAECDGRLAEAAFALHCRAEAAPSRWVEAAAFHLRAAAEAGRAGQEDRERQQRDSAGRALTRALQAEGGSRASAAALLHLLLQLEEEEGEGRPPSRGGVEETERRRTAAALLHAMEASARSIDAEPHSPHAQLTAATAVSRTPLDNTYHTHALAGEKDRDAHLRCPFSPMSALLLACCPLLSLCPVCAVSLDDDSGCCGWSWASWATNRSQADWRSSSWTK